MPLNLIKVYNDHLDIVALSEMQRTRSLKGVFNKDFDNQPDLYLNGRKVTPTPKDGVIKIETLFRHLITVMIDKTTRKRAFHLSRSLRLHWVRRHLELFLDHLLVFTVKEPEGYRTYIYNQEEKYVVVLEPLKKVQEYYLLSAYPLEGRDLKRNSIMKKYDRREPEVL